jgi:hypothetical protein
MERFRIKPELANLFKPDMRNLVTSKDEWIGDWGLTEAALERVDSVKIGFGHYNFKDGDQGASCGASKEKGDYINLYIRFPNGGVYSRLSNEMRRDFIALLQPLVEQFYFPTDKAEGREATTEQGETVHLSEVLAFAEWIGSEYDYSGNGRWRQYLTEISHSTMDVLEWWRKNKL